MDASAGLTSGSGDHTREDPRSREPTARVVLHVGDDHIVIEEPGSGRRTSVKPFVDFFSLGGSVPVPTVLEGASWREVRRSARAQRADRRR